MTVAWDDPVVAWDDESVSWDGTFASFSVTAVSPNQAQRGRTRNVIVVGTGFAETSTVSFSGVGITIVEQERLSSTAIRVRIQVDIAAPLGGRDVTVTHPTDPDETLVNGLTIVEFIPGGAASRSHQRGIREWKWGRLQRVV